MTTPPPSGRTPQEKKKKGRLRRWFSFVNPVQLPSPRPFFLFPPGSFFALFTQLLWSRLQSMWKDFRKGAPHRNRVGFFYVGSIFGLVAVLEGYGFWYYADEFDRPLYAVTGISTVAVLGVLSLAAFYLALKK